VCSRFHGERVRIAFPVLLVVVIAVRIADDEGAVAAAAAARGRVRASRRPILHHGTVPRGLSRASQRLTPKETKQKENERKRKEIFQKKLNIGADSSSFHLFSPFHFFIFPFLFLFFFFSFLFFFLPNLKTFLAASARSNSFCHSMSSVGTPALDGSERPPVASRFSRFNMAWQKKQKKNKKKTKKKKTKQNGIEEESQPVCCESSGHCARCTIGFTPIECAEKRPETSRRL
jgi:hypothetical protein